MSLYIYKFLKRFHHSKYIINTLFQYTCLRNDRPNWNDWSSVLQQRATRTLRVAVSRMKASDVAKFLPKILMFLDVVIGGTDSRRDLDGGEKEGGRREKWRVRLEGVKAWKVVCDRLTQQALCANLSALLVGLFPLLEHASEVRDAIVTHVHSHAYSLEQARNQSNKWWEGEEEADLGLGMAWIGVTETCGLPRSLHR